METNELIPDGINKIDAGAHYEIHGESALVYVESEDDWLFAGSFVRCGDSERIARIIVDAYRAGRREGVRLACGIAEKYADDCRARISQHIANESANKCGEVNHEEG